MIERIKEKIKDLFRFKIVIIDCETRIFNGE